MRDFFYKNNDIIVVLIILIAAGFLIYDRIGIIMDYPAQIAARQAQTQIVEDADSESSEESEDAEASE